MKLPFSVERLIQGICVAAVLWTTCFLYKIWSRALPDTTFVKTESIWEADKKSQTALFFLSEQLEKLRQPIAFINNGQIKNLRNVFSPPVQEASLPSVFCETCGGENLGNASICKHCGSLIEPVIREDTDKDGMPDDWEIKYSFDPKDPSDAHEDADGDSVDNLNEYLRGNNPRKDKRVDNDAAPDTSPLPFDLVKTYQNPIHILFMGYILLRDGRYEVQVNWAGKTEFYKLGEEIRGYAILDFKKIIQTVPNPKTGVPVYEDSSFIVCQKKKFQPKTFVKGKLVTDNDVFAKVRLTDSLEEREVHIDSILEDPIQNRIYKVTDIGLHPQKIIVVDAAKKPYTLQTQKQSPVSTQSGT
jgi:hypothetical protein